MRKTFLALLFIGLYLTNCNAQPRSEYEIYSTEVGGAVKYHFFLEKSSVSPYTLQQGMDYIPSAIPFKVGESATPSFTINLMNDGSEYRVGVVAENTSGFYSGMGVGSGSVGSVPVSPANIGLRKK